MASGWLYHTKGSITVSMAWSLPFPKVAFSESQGLEATSKAQKGWGQEEVGFWRGRDCRWPLPSVPRFQVRLLQQ